MSELEPTYFPPGELLADIRALIAEARRQTTVAVNMGLTLLYWRIGQRIHREVLGSERAAYGEQIVVTVSRQLVADYGRGYSEKNLRRMVQFAELFPEQEIVVTLSRQLSWFHFIAFLPLSQPFQREFYAEMARIEGWSVRTLRARIDSMLYERTALSKQPDAMIRQELAILRSKGDLTPAISECVLTHADRFHAIPGKNRMITVDVVTKKKSGNKHVVKEVRFDGAHIL